MIFSPDGPPRLLLPLCRYGIAAFLLDAMPAAPAAATPGYTVAQDEKATTLQLDVPGLAANNSDHHRRCASAGQKHRRCTAPVHRAWSYPPIDAAASSARLEHGVLTLTLVRQAPARAPWS